MDCIFIDQLQQKVAFSGLPLKLGTRIGFSIRRPCFGEELWQRAWILRMVVQRNNAMITSRESNDDMERLVYVEEIGLPRIESPKPTRNALLAVLGRVRSIEATSEYGENVILRLRFSGHHEVIRFRCAQGKVLGPVPRDFFEFPDEPKKESLARSVSGVLSPGGGFVIFE